MIYLTGRPYPDLPTILTPARWVTDPPPLLPWAADTGCFRSPHTFDFASYLGWLNGLAADGHAEQCLFATAPDRVGDAAATLEVARPCLPYIRELGYPAALVAQDGLETLQVPWDEFDCLFTGGSTAWKLSEAAYGLQREAKARGKWTHMGRVNSEIRLRAAAAAGYDSADGTYLAFGPERNRPRLERWMAGVRRQGGLGL